MKKSEIRWALVVGLVLVAALSCLLGVPYVPTNDGPQHLLSAHIENDFSSPESIYPEFVDIAPSFASRGFSMVYAPLSELFSWPLALRLTVVFMVALFALGLWFLAVSVDRRRGPLGLLAFVLPLSWPFYMGFFRFVIGQSFGFVVLGLAVRWRKPSRSQFAILGAVLFLQAHLHLFTALLSGLCIGLLMLIRDSGRERLRHLLSFLVSAIPTLGVLWFTTRDDAATIGTEAATQLRWEPPLRWALNLPSLLAPGPIWRTVLVLALVLSGVMFGLRAGLRKKSREQLGLVTIAGLLLSIGSFAPMDVPGWQFFAPRFLGTGAFLAIVALPLETWSIKWHRNSEVFKQLAFCALPLAGLLATWQLNRRLYAACSDSLSQLAALGGPPAVHTNGLKLPMVFDSSCKGASLPYVAPELHAGALFAAVEGGLVPHLFAGAQGVHTLLSRESAPWPPIPGLALWAISTQDNFHTDSSLRAYVISDYVSYGRHYDEVLLFGARDEDFAAFAARGYLWERRSGTFGSGKFVGCTLPLELDVAGLQGALDLKVEQLPLRRPVLHRTLPLPESKTGTVTLRLDRLTCGAIGLRLTDAAGPVCFLALDLTKESSPVRCAR